MKRAIWILLSTLISHLTFAQGDFTKTDTTKSIYKSLETKKSYKVVLSSSSINGVTTYKLFNKKVSKSTYDKYNTMETLNTCKPCILMTYDVNDKLLSKGIQYTDCPAGFWIEYFPNGQVKLIGHYKENETGDWSNAWNGGFCRKDGAFTYFNEKGEELYTEYWKDGQLIKKNPE